MMALALTTRGDPMVAAVARALAHHGRELLIFERERIPLEASIALVGARGAPPRATIAVDGRAIDGDELGFVWERSRGRPSFPLAEGKKRTYVEGECARLVDALSVLLDDRPWMNPIDAARRARLKPIQHRAALAVGLAPIAAVFGNDANLALACLPEVDDLVVKALHERRYPAAQGEVSTEHVNELPTVRVDRARFEESRDVVAACPLVVQPFVPKRLEHRVVVVGDETFSCRMRRRDGAAFVDVRELSESELVLERAAPSGATLEKIVQLVRSLGLVYGCVDLLVTDVGEELFLEINEAGQYLWMEERLGLPISAAIARMIADALDRRSNIETDWPSRERRA